MKRREQERPQILVPPELAAGPHVTTWCTDLDREALAILAPGHPQRGQVVRRAQHAACAAFSRARDAWLTEHGHTLRELRRDGLLTFRPPHFDPPDSSSSG